MTDNLIRDISELHAVKGHSEKHRAMDQSQLVAFFKFRKEFLAEELTELEDAKSADDVVDALIDLLVVAIGTLDSFGVDGQKAWDEVHTKNMQKHAGSNPSRPNEFGLPDLIKPPGWKPPSHKGNCGRFIEIFEE